MTPSAVPGSPLDRMHEQGASLATLEPPTGMTNPAFSCLLLRIPIISSESPRAQSGAGVMWSYGWAAPPRSPVVGAPMVPATTPTRLPRLCCPPEGRGQWTPSSQLHLSQQYNGLHSAQAATWGPFLQQNHWPQVTALYDRGHFFPLTGTMRATGPSALLGTAASSTRTPAAVTGVCHLPLQLRPAFEWLHLDCTCRLKPGSPTGPLGPCPSPVWSPGKCFLSAMMHPQQSTRGACVLEDRGSSRKASMASLVSA